MMIQSRFRELEPGEDRSSERSALVNATRTSTSTAWRTFPANDSIAPAVTAAAPGSPCRWKNRMSTAILATLEGTARFRYDVASCST